MPDPTELRRIAPGSRRERMVMGLAVVVGVVVLLLDQLTKLAVCRRMDLHEGIVIIRGWFDFLHVRNIGAAWSILAGHGVFLLGIGLAVAAALIAFFRHIAEGCSERYYAICLMLGGIFGNSIDRMFRGYVVDFISLHYRDIYYYPVFNVADMGICIGALILTVSGLCRKTIKSDKE